MTEKAILYEGTGIDATHGFNYEYQATSLAYLRCESLHREFQKTRNSGVKSFAVANNVKEFRPIDDVVIKIEYFEGETTKTKSIFVQCKHAADPEKNPKSKIQNLLDNDKAVQKYFDKFIDIHKKFESGNENELQPEQSKTNIHNFFCDVFKDCEFVFYTNVKPEITSTSKFELSTNVAQNNIAEKLLGTTGVRCYRLKNSEGDKLECNPSDEQLKKLFCENFTLMLNHDNLECYIAEEIKLILKSVQCIRDISKYFTEEIRHHFNVSGLHEILSEESGMVGQIKAYITLKSQSEKRIDQFKKNCSFHNLFSEETVRRIEQRLSTNSNERVCISTKFMELEKRKVVQCFKDSDDVCLLIISNDVDETNWYIARETKTYSKWNNVKICSEISMRNDFKLKSNEVFVQIEKTCEECDPIACFETFSPETEQILLSSKVSFQGILQELRQCSNGKWKNFLDEDTICKMLEDKHVLNIGEPLPKLDFYIDRKLKIRTINATKLPKINETDRQNFKLLLFSERQKKIPNNVSTFVLFKKMTEARDLLKNIPNKTDDDIHLCGYGPEYNPEKLELIYSFGKTSKLVEFATVDEKYLLQNKERSKVVILSDIAGMGKTTTLLTITKMLKEENPSDWVFFLDLSKHLKDLKNGKFSDKMTAIDFVATKLLKLNVMELTIFIDACIETGNVVLCFDAFDEISPDAEIILPKLLKTLEETKIKSIILSSRTNFTRHLEQQFYQHSIEFIPFSSKEKEEFLLEKWRTMMENEKKEIDVDEPYMKDVIKNILGAVVYDSNSIVELLGIPLQMRMISDIFFDTFISLLEGKNGAEEIRVNLFSLFDKFVTFHIIRYYTEKEGYDWENLRENQKKRLLMEKMTGVEKFSTNFVCPELGIFKVDDDVRSKLCNEIGLLKNLNPPVFLHRTFAEFLAAKYFVSQIVDEDNEYCKELSSFFHESILVNPEFETLRTFINATFGHGDFNERTIYRAYAISRGNEGNTAIHFAAFEGNIEILKKLLVLNNYNINETNSSKQTPLFLACQNPKTSEAAKYLINNGHCKVDAEDNDGNTAIHFAVEQGHIDIIKILLNHDLTLLNKKNINGETPLNWASFYGNCVVVNELLNNYMDCKVHEEDKDGETALHVAIRQGHTDIITILLNHDSTLLNKQLNDGETPLHLASVYGRCDVVRELLKYENCKVDAEDNDGNTAIHVAVVHGHIDIIKILLERDSSLLNKQNINRETPLYLASWHGNCVVVNELLLNYEDCKVDVEDKDGETALHAAIRQGHTGIITILLNHDRTLLNKQKINGQTPLHLASVYGRCDVVRELLNYENCKVDAEDNDGNTAIHVAVVHECIDIIKILLERDSSLLNKQNKLRETPLYLASWYGNSVVVNELLNNYKDCMVDVEDEDGETALHVAIRRGNTEIITILLNHDSTLLNKQLNDGQTPLHLASVYGRCDVVRVLLNYENCKVDAENSDGNTAFHVAVEEGHIDIIKILLESNPSLLNKQNIKGNTPLHLAVRSRKYEIMKQLLSYSHCSLGLKDNKGKTALKYAQDKGYTEMVKAILERDTQTPS